LLAVVLIGKSRRFPNKHFFEINRGLRLIDIVFDSLRRAKCEILVYSKIPFSSPFPLLEDKEEWILPSLIFLFEFLFKMGRREVLIVGGDMPLISVEGIEFLMSCFSSNDLALVPRWQNGYLEPLFAIYKPELSLHLRESSGRGIRSLQKAIREAPHVKFVEAESFPPHTFFNVNDLKDLDELKRLMKLNVDI